jgi:uncharacterized protein (DUF58 family)
MSGGRVRPTQHGRIAIVIAALVLLVGLVRGINLLSLFGFTIVATLLFNMLLALRQTAGLSLQRRVPHPLSVGQRTVLEGRLTGTTGRKRLNLLIVDRGPTPALVALVPRLAGRETAEVRSEWVPSRRGRQRIGPVVVVGRYPFGLIEHRVELLPAQEVIVWPALGEIERGRLMRYLERCQTRQLARRARPERTAQQEIYGLRPFRAGDSPRLIHWRTSARRGELMVREYEDIPPDSLAVILDATAPGTPAQLEQAISFVATLCWEWCRRRGDRLVLGVVGKEVSLLAGATGPELGEGLLDLLAVVEPAGQEHVGEFLRLLGREVAPGSGVLLVSAGPSGLEAVLRRERGLSVLALTAAGLANLDGYTKPEAGRS